MKVTIDTIVRLEYSTEVDLPEFGDPTPENVARFHDGNGREQAVDLAVDAGLLMASAREALVREVGGEDNVESWRYFADVLVFPDGEDEYDEELEDDDEPPAGDWVAWYEHDANLPNYGEDD